jgi:hypothetical protein
MSAPCAALRAVKRLGRRVSSTHGALGGRFRENIREERLFARGYPVHGDRKFGGKKADRVVSVEPGRDWL